MQSLRVLAVTNMYPTPDRPIFGKFVARQMASVEKLGHRVEIEYIRGERSLGPYLRGIGSVRARARKDSFDIVHAHYGLTGFVASFQPLPLVVSFCGDDLLGTPDGKGGNTIKSRVGIRLSHIAAQHAHGIICKSEELRQALPRSRDRERAQVIGNGVDTLRFNPGDRSEARLRLGVDPGEKLILFPHDPTQFHVKRFDLARAAVLRLGGTNPGLRLWEVFGVSPETMPDYYRAADCVLLTSDHEGSPNVVKEALCCDVPVVSVDAGDARRWMDLAPGCALVHRDVASISQGIEQVLAGPRRVDGSKVRAALAIDVVAREIVRVYERVLSRSPLLAERRSDSQGAC